MTRLGWVIPGAGSYPRGRILHDGGLMAGEKPQYPGTRRRRVRTGR
jgi:hypothetical protein